MRLSKAPDYARILQTLQVGLDESFMYRYPHECSGGQRQRIAIARTSFLNHLALFLTNHLLLIEQPHGKS